METIARTRAIGGSLVVTIPAEIVKEEGLKPGQVVEIEVRKLKKSFFGITGGKLGPFTREDRMEDHD